MYRHVHIRTCIFFVYTCSCMYIDTTLSDWKFKYWHTIVSVVTQHARVCLALNPNSFFGVFKYGSDSPQVPPVWHPHSVLRPFYNGVFRVCPCSETGASEWGIALGGGGVVGDKVFLLWLPILFYFSSNFLTFFFLHYFLSVTLLVFPCARELVYHNPLLDSVWGTQIK